MFLLMTGGVFYCQKRKALPSLASLLGYLVILIMVGGYVGQANHLNPYLVSKVKDMMCYVRSIMYLYTYYDGSTLS